MIGHVDADCFYVSAERVRFPHLRGMPVGVLGNHGACVIAKSYEMKAAGVTTGMPIWEARPLCPHGVYVKRDFEWYEVLSRQMLGIVTACSPLVEFYSIDEFFFATQDAHLSEAIRLQAEIARKVGVPVSVGIAPTKLLAKLISDSAKPFGCGVVRDEDARRQLLHGKPVTDITGIAERSAARLAKHGITTCEQFANASRPFIRWLLTKRGEDIWWELNGTSVLPILTKRPDHQFLSRGGSIGAASNDPDRIQAFVVRNAERLIEALQFYQVHCDYLILALLFKDRPEQRKRATILDGTAEEIIHTALRLCDQLWRPPAMVHYMHVIAGGLRRERQRCLFPEASRVQELKQAINQKVGRFAIRSGLTLSLTDVHRDPANNYDICDVYGKRNF